MVVQFTQKVDTEEVLAKGLLMMEGESVYITVWIKKS